MKAIQFVPHRNHITLPLQNESEIQFVPHKNHIKLPLQNESEIQFVPHRDHITLPLQNESEIQLVPHRNRIKLPLQNESGLKPIYMEVCFWALLFMLLVILHHLLNVSVQLANKRGFKQKKNKKMNSWVVLRPIGGPHTPFQFFSPYTQSVLRLRHGISPTQGPYLHPKHKYRKSVHKHPSLE
jgi:hypothetical protein